MGPRPKERMKGGISEQGERTPRHPATAAMLSPSCSNLSLESGYCGEEGRIGVLSEMMGSEFDESRCVCMWSIRMDGEIATVAVSSRRIRYDRNQDGVVKAS